MAALLRLDQEDPITLEEVAAVWPAVVAWVGVVFGPVRASLVRAGRPVAVDGHRVTIALPGGETGGRSFYLDRVSGDEELMAGIAERLAGLLGVPVAIHWVAGSETSP